MDSMQKSDRKGVDIRVALASSAKTGTYKGGQEPGSDDSAPQSTVQAKTFRSVVKTLGRGVARVFFRAVRPLGRPIMFRLRAYFTQMLHEELQQAQLRNTSELDQHAQRQHQLTERLLSTQTAAILRAIKETQRANKEAPAQSLSRQSVDAVGITNLVRQLLSPHDTFLDVGTGIGPHVLTAHFALRGTGRMVAFEPRTATSEPNSPAVQIDDVLDRSARTGLIWIDAGLASPEVLEGAAFTLSSNTDIALVIEFDKAAAQPSRAPSADWEACLQKLGFASAPIDSIFGVQIHGQAATLGAAPPAALFSARPASSAWARVRVIQ